MYCQEYLGNFVSKPEVHCSTYRLSRDKNYYEGKRRVFMSCNGKVVTLFKEDLLKSCKEKKIEDLGIYDFKIDIKEIETADLVRFVSADYSSFKIFKDRYSIKYGIINR
jgi:hypothetical protein